MTRTTVELGPGALWLGLALLGLGCTEEPTAPPVEPPTNVILVVVDTLRADHLGCYGYPRDTSPRLDALARDAVVFTKVRSQSSCTFASVNSMLTSRYTARFLGQPDGRMGIPSEVPTIARILTDHGFDTAAVSASPIVRATPSDSNPHGGFDAGFRIFDEQCLWKPAECVNAAARRVIGELDSPFFLYLHYMDPHDPYRPPGSFGRRFADDYSGFDFIARGDPNPIEEMIYGSGATVDIDERDIGQLVDLYDDEIAYFDERFGELLDWLAADALLDETMVIVASDHGEEFLEHGHIKHCRTVFDSSTHTPLIISVPGVAAHRPVEAAVENLDIVPTILDYVGLDAPDGGVQGRSLRPLMEGRAIPADFVFSLQYPWASVDDGRRKLISNLTRTDHRLYDLATDPSETSNLAAADPETVGRLRAVLAPWLAREVDALAGRTGLEESIAQLEALGYLR